MSWREGRVVTAYDFTLRFALLDAARPVDDRLERLAAAVCDDAIVGIGHTGRIALGFTRDAPSPRRAVLTALEDARRAMPDAQLVEASPDLVGLTDIADIMGFTRQNARKLLAGGGAPAPVHEGKPSLWRLAHVLRWLRDERGYAIDEHLVGLAAVTMQLNIAAANVHADPPVQRSIRVAAGP